MTQTREESKIIQHCEVLNQKLDTFSTNNNIDVIKQIDLINQYAASFLILLNTVIDKNHDVDLHIISEIHKTNNNIINMMFKLKMTKEVIDLQSHFSTIIKTLEARIHSNMQDDLVTLINTNMLDVQPNQTSKKLPYLIRQEWKEKLERLESNIRIFEGLKYPSTHYRQYIDSYKTAGPLEGFNVTYICYDGKDLSQSDFNQVNVASVATRKLSLIAGMMNALSFSKSYLIPHNNEDNFERNYLYNKLVELADSVIKENDPNINNRMLSSAAEKDIDDFIGYLVNMIKAATSLRSDDDIIRQIRNAERYFVAERNQNRILVVNSRMTIGEQETEVLQVDVSLNNHLSAEQKNLLILIHGNSPPAWYVNLPSWEQDWLKFHIPRNIDSTLWKTFEKLGQPSAMQHIPGITNARTHYLLQWNSEKNQFESLSHSTKTSTMVSYEMRSSSEEGDKETQRTADQLLDQLIKNAQKNFDELWGDFFDNDTLSFKPKPLVYFQSLLSDTIGGGDTYLVNKQHKAILEVTKKYPGITIISGNDPVNIARITGMEIISNRWEHSSEILKYSDHFLPLMEEAMTRNIYLDKLSEKRLQAYSLAKSASNNLHRLKKERHNYMDVKLYKRNYAVYKVAYTSILAEAMGGAVCTNCKSGKDRTGIDELYRNAMIIYFKMYGELPGYADDDLKRKNFIAIIIPLFNSMKAQEASSTNTPGSFGIKDDARMFCEDIREALGDDFINSNNLGKTNKTGKFLKDEGKQTKEIENVSKTQATILPTQSWPLLNKEILNVLDCKIKRPSTSQKKAKSNITESSQSGDSGSADNHTKSAK